MEEESGRRGIPSVCVDLTLRIMKDTDDSTTFLSLLKTAYGIDLDYLDRHPFASEGMLDPPEDLSTAALTTIVDYFGRTSQLSKMVATFEVLKAPLSAPSRLSREEGENGVTSKDEDDDDDYVIPMDTLTRPLPSANPNITTYNTLIRHCTSQRHKTFAKHYVLEALDHDRKSSGKLQAQLESFFPQSESGAPPMQLVELNVEGLQAGNVRANVDTFRPLVGLANRDKSYGLMKWLLMRIREVLRWKTAEQRYFERLLGLEPAPFACDGVLNGEEELVSSQASSNERGQASWEAADGLSNPSDFFTPSSSSSSVSSTPSPPSSTSEPIPSSPSSTSTPPSKTFYPLQHLSLLRHQRRTLYDLSKRIGTSLSRIADRSREHLGRRVWNGKRIFLRHKRRRVLLSKEQWRERVHFGGRRKATEGDVSVQS